MCFPRSLVCITSGRAGSRLTAGHTFPGCREGSWTVWVHTCVGSVPDSPVMAFAWRRKQTSPTSSTDFPVKRFRIQKKKNYNHKEKGFAVCTKGPGCVKSDSEMEPETGDNGAGRKRWGRGTRASVPGPEGQGETPAQRSASVRALPPAPPPTATPSLCPPPSPHEPRFQRWAPGLNPNTSRDSCHRPTQSPRRPLLKGPGEAERILGAETISGLSELFIL